MLRSILVVWLAVAIVGSFTIPFAKAPPLVPLLVFGTLAAWTVAYRRSSRVRGALERVDLRLVLVAHGLRLPIGVAFLVEEAHGRLPALFAERAGWGDIVAGGLALVVASLVGPDPDGTRARRGARRVMVLAWNVLGLVDILVVIATVQVMVLVQHDEAIARALGSMPYALLPTFVVPFVVATHALVFARVRADAAADEVADAGDAWTPVRAGSGSSSRAPRPRP